MAADDRVNHWLVEVQLLATEQGGRSTAPPLDYRVSLQLDDDRSRAFDGRLRF